MRTSALQSCIMHIVLTRKFKRPLYTIGTLAVDGEYFCDTLEDPVRPAGQKVPGQTAVPAGVYEAVLTLSPRFKRVLPLLLDVPGFTGVRIHAGNTAEDTQGCILVGWNTEKGRITSSRLTEDALVTRLKRAQDEGEKIYVEIKEAV